MNPAELSQQLKKPTGETGLKVALELNKSNRGLYELAFEQLELRDGAKLLEIGFGNGKHFPDYFEMQQDLQIIGVDFSSDMCREAKSLNHELIEADKLSIYCADTTSLPFQDEKFDVTIANNLIYFLDPPEIHLKEIHRSLKPGGRFLIGYRPRHSIEKYEFTQQNFIMYESDELASLLEENGFKLIREESRSYQKEMEDGEIFDVVDHCMTVQKIST